MMGAGKGRIHQQVRVTVCRSPDFHPEAVVYVGVVTAEGEDDHFGEWLTLNLGGEPERDITISHLEQPNIVVEVLSRDSWKMKCRLWLQRVWKRLTERIARKRPSK